MKNNNWKVIYTSRNNNTQILEQNLSYNEARKMAKEYSDVDDYHFYEAVKND